MQMGFEEAGWALWSSLSPTVEDTPQGAPLPWAKNFLSRQNPDFETPLGCQPRPQQPAALRQRGIPRSVTPGLLLGPPAPPHALPLTAHHTLHVPYSQSHIVTCVLTHAHPCLYTHAYTLIWMLIRKHTHDTCTRGHMQSHRYT